MIENAKKEFKKYVDGFLDYGKEMTLKYHHTLRVMELCRNIAISLNLSEEMIEIAQIIGLLHDIGRFEQWKNYHTFHDQQSFDHAHQGVEILTKNQYIRKYIKTEKYDEIILKSVEYHNKYEIPKDLKEEEKMYCQIIRDADKIDILNIYSHKQIPLIKTVKQENFGEGGFSEEVYQSLLQRKSIQRTRLKNPLDYLSIPIGFIFDMNYAYGIEYISKENYYSILIQQYIEETKDEKFKNQLEKIQKVIKEYSKERYHVR